MRNTTLGMLDAWQSAGGRREYTVRRSPSYGDGATEVEVVLADMETSPPKVISQKSSGPNGVARAARMALERWSAGDFDPPEAEDKPTPKPAPEEKKKS